MPQPAAQQFSGIFVCYRRGDSSGDAGRLFDRLAARFGRDRIFMDIDTIEAGVDFHKVIQDAVGSCQILLAIIGQRWLTSTEGSARRLDNPDDFIRLEIIAALDRDIRVIPVLVQGAAMPKLEDLPAALDRLARRQALELDDKRWHSDVDELVGVLEKTLARRDVPQPTPQPIEPRREAHAPRKSQIALAIAGVALVIIMGFGIWVWLLSNSTIKSTGTTDGGFSNQSLGKETVPPTNNAADTSERPSATEPGSRPTIVGIEFVLIRPGSFLMGSKEDEVDNKSDEQPVHEVTINYSFYMGKFEVTQRQFAEITGLRPSYNVTCGVNCPVESVSWEDVKDFIVKLNQRSNGFKYRLPTEAEWEYACRAGTNISYRRNQGTDYYRRYKNDRTAQAWFSDNSGDKTHVVGERQLNQWGLGDMLGNVWEWCEDQWHTNYDGAPNDGRAWLPGRETRVLRGGAFDGVLGRTTPAARYGEMADVRSQNKGFRLVAERVSGRP